MSLRVKICGITQLEDALCAENAGAAAIGFNFVPGTKRCIDVARAQLISSQLSALTTRVGVFRDATLETILEVARRVQLGAAQLHGQESDEFAVLVSSHLPVIRAVSYRPGRLLPEAQTLLLDGLDPGSGQAFDWASLPHSSLQGRRWLLAGGLNPENVAAAVRAVHPWGVDVSSGVERSPGVKDQTKIRAFIAAAQSL